MKCGFIQIWNDLLNLSLLCQKNNILRHLKRYFKMLEADWPDPHPSSKMNRLFVDVQQAVTETNGLFLHVVFVFHEFSQGFGSFCDVSLRRQVVPRSIALQAVFMQYICHY